MNEMHPPTWPIDRDYAKRYDEGRQHDLDVFFSDRDAELARVEAERKAFADAAAAERYDPPEGVGEAYWPNDDNANHLNAQMAQESEYWIRDRERRQMRGR